MKVPIIHTPHSSHIRSGDLTLHFTKTQSRIELDRITVQPPLSTDAKKPAQGVLDITSYVLRQLGKLQADLQNSGTINVHAKEFKDGPEDENHV